jgi:hypothetical protein
MRRQVSRGAKLSIIDAGRDRAMLHARIRQELPTAR